MAAQINKAATETKMSELHGLTADLMQKRLQAALTTERTETDTYIASVQELIKAQETERQALIKAINKPKPELYTGYNTSDKWEGGIRIVWQLK